MYYLRCLVTLTFGLEAQCMGNVIWFNPPYNSNVKTNIGHKFLQAIDDCFPKNNPLHKIFNRNTLKLSYSCMPNIRNIISDHCEGSRGLGPRLGLRLGLRWGLTFNCIQSFKSRLFEPLFLANFKVFFTVNEQ